MFLAFFGEYRGHEHPHESPPIMLVPLAILALLSIGGGFLFKIPDFLGTIFPTLETTEDIGLMAISTAAGVIGILIAYVMYIARPGMADSFAASVGVLYRTVREKYYVDEIYNAVVVKPLVGGSRLLWRGFDAAVIDGAVNGVGRRARGIGNILRLAQSGNIRSYAGWVLLGSVAVIAWIVTAINGGAR
jgi:NADH-quinone oxidoreductase subunit L